MTREHSVERTGLGPLQFAGVLLARSSSARAGKARWTELELYRTEGGMYVTVVIGESTLPDDDVIRAATFYNTATEAVKSFARNGRLSFPAVELLDKASEVDGAIDNAFAALENTATRIK